MDKNESPKEATAANIRERLQRDKAHAKEISHAAREELGDYKHFRITVDITGRPKNAHEFNQQNQDKYRSLEAVSRSPFFQHATATRTEVGETCKMEVFITKARDIAGSVGGDEWTVVSWTSKLAEIIRASDIGSVTELVHPRTGTKTQIKMGDSSKYEDLLPRFVNGEFLFSSGKSAVANEDDLDRLIGEAEQVPQELPAVEYSAKATFGLDDIIVLVDRPQQAAMGLPLRETVIIEGPPGSGKTSVGLMRIAVLHDQQWDILGFDRERDHPYHTASSTRILVYNDEMVEYLKGLAQSIQIKGVRVEMTRHFLTAICRATGLLTGVPRRDRPSLAVMKARREAMHAFFAGLKSHVKTAWTALETQLRQELSVLGPDFMVFADRMKDWAKQVQAARIVDDRIEGSVNLAELLHETADSVRRGQSSTRPKAATGQPPLLSSEMLQQRLTQAKDILTHSVRSASNRVSVTRAMFEVPEFISLKVAMRDDGVTEKAIEDGERLWRRQYAGEQPSYSELDLAMTAWLGARILLWNRNSRPWIGGALEKLTHIVIDEAQDLSPSHIAVLASQLDRDGTMTLVGDLHQNLNPRTGLRSWDETRLPHARRTVFGVNHRQTFQLGTFLQQLHSGLFGEQCQWQASSKMEGRVARAGTARSWSSMAKAIAEEIRYWREAVQGPTGATIAVVYDGKIAPKRLKALRARLERALGDLLVKVDIASAGAGGEALRRTDQVTIASVRQTKGLEFDAVIFIEPVARWAKPEGETDVRIRNGLYVATSRARAGLSLCMSNLPSCVADIERAGACERVQWEGDEAPISAE